MIYKSKFFEVISNKWEQSHRFCLYELDEVLYGRMLWKAGLHGSHGEVAN